MIAFAAALIASAHLVAAHGQTSVPPPLPFPQASKPAATPTPTPAPAPQTPAAAAPDASASAALAATAPSEALLGVRVFPGAEFLASVDAGKGQRYYLFGTNSSYATVVDYYKTQLKSSRELFKSPAMWQFDLPGKFQDETMAYPPSVLVKDYTWNGSEGYLHILGTTEKRFRTVLQIVPATAR